MWHNRRMLGSWHWGQTVSFMCHGTSAWFPQSNSSPQSHHCHSVVNHCKPHWQRNGQHHSLNTIWWHRLEVRNKIFFQWHKFFIFFIVAVRVWILEVTQSLGKLPKWPRCTFWTNHLMLLMRNSTFYFSNKKNEICSVKRKRFFNDSQIVGKWKKRLPKKIKTTFSFSLSVLCCCLSSCWRRREIRIFISNIWVLE